MKPRTTPLNHFPSLESFELSMLCRTSHCQRLYRAADPARPEGQTDVVWIPQIDTLGSIGFFPPEGSDGSVEIIATGVQLTAARKWGPCWSQLEPIEANIQWFRRRALRLNAPAAFEGDRSGVDVVICFWDADKGHVVARATADEIGWGAQCQQGQSFARIILASVGCNAVVAHKLADRLCLEVLANHSWFEPLILRSSDVSDFVRRQHIDLMTEQSPTASREVAEIVG